MKDNFSRQSDLYSKFRPVYPQELYDFIIGNLKERKVAWDCGTGNGQAAQELSKYFEQVFATDISQKQIDNAYKAGNIIYSVQPAEKTNFADNSFDLISVSQALHWFQFDEFYSEVKRVARPGAWIAVWMYGLLNISPEIDEIVCVQFYKNTLGIYWDYERKFVDENYSTIPFPFREIQTPLFEIHYKWTLQELEGYLNTWSALQKFIAINQFNPVDVIIQKIKPIVRNEKMNVVFPLHLRMGQIEK
ncbi:MAG: class I SAM-dependent methyltransferase [Bacteroidota bacterium]